MKRMTKLLAGWILALTTFAVLDANATIPSRFTIAAFVYVQDDSFTEGDLYKGSIERVRVTTRDLLELLHDTTGIEFPRGSFIDGLNGRESQ